MTAEGWQQLQRKHGLEGVQEPITAAWRSIKSSYCITGSIFLKLG